MKRKTVIYAMLLAVLTNACGTSATTPALSDQETKNTALPITSIPETQTAEATGIGADSEGPPRVAEPMVCQARAVQSGTWLERIRLVSQSRPHRLESRMRENRTSGLEGGVGRKPHPYPYQTWRRLTAGAVSRCAPVPRCASFHLVIFQPVAKVSRQDFMTDS